VELAGWGVRILLPRIAEPTIVPIEEVAEYLSRYF